jgi:hypothetical protein
MFTCCCLATVFSVVMTYSCENSSYSFNNALYLIDVLYQSRICKADYVYLIWCYNSCLATWMVKSLNAAKFRPFIFSDPGFAMSLCFYHVRSHDFVRLPLVACTVLLYNRIHMEVESHVQIENPVCTLENVEWCRGTCFGCASILRGGWVSAINSLKGHARVNTGLISVWFGSWFKVGS